MPWRTILANFKSDNKSEDKKAIREMIRAIDESSRSAGQLLDHAMVNFRADQLQTEALDLRKLTVETVERLSPTAELKDISIIMQDQGGDFGFDGDPIMLQNALRNILDNAIKYSYIISSITRSFLDCPFQNDYYI